MIVPAPRVARPLVFSLVALGFVSAVAAQDPVDSARATIRRIMAERAIPSVAIAAAQHGRIVWEEGFGWADKEKKIAATATTLYSLASISKPITATGLMVQVVRGKVRLDRPANDYLGSGKLTAREGKAADATVRRVANHTSGLPLHYQFFYVDRAARRPTMDEAIAHYGILVAPPGTQFTYSNLGYGILERIIERTSGTPFEVFMQREVFEPLGLPHMAIVTAPIGGDTVAVRYDNQGNPVPWYDFDHRGASAVYSSARDLARFGMFHLGDRLADQRQILERQALDSMHRITARRAEKVGYGVGWQTFEDDNGYVSLGHSGGMPGVSTVLRIYPEADAVVVVLINSAPGDASNRIAAAVGATMMPRMAERIRNPAPSNTAATRFEPGTELVGDWAGTLTTWKGVVPATLSIQADGTGKATIAGSTPESVTSLRLQGGRLTGNLAGTVPTPDASREPGGLTFDVRLHEGKLSGSVSALGTNVYALSSYLTLSKRPTP